MGVGGFPLGVELMGGLIGFFKGFLFGTEREELSMAGSYKALLGDALLMNRALMDENMALREGKKMSVWDLASQFLQMPPQTQAELLKQAPQLIQSVLSGKGLNTSSDNRQA